jgi:hypothetical protein
MNLNKIKDKIKKFLESKSYVKFMYIIGGFFILVFVFQIGMFAGYRKASFSRDWGNNYERNFGPNRPGPQIIKDNFGNLPNAHGAIGKIIKIEFPNIFVLDKDQTEKILIVDDNTNILERNEKVTSDSLAVDKYIVVIGTPNDSGQIEAKLIRIIPTPGEMMKINMSEFNNKNI